MTARFRHDGTVGELSPGFFCHGHGIGRLAGVSEVDVPLLDDVDEEGGEEEEETHYVVSS